MFTWLLQSIAVTLVGKHVLVTYAVSPKVSNELLQTTPLSEDLLKSLLSLSRVVAFVVLLEAGS